MNRFLLLLTATFSATVFAAVPTAPAKADPAKGKEIVSTVCVACHNADGNSTIPINPKLAGQHPEYLLKQMRNFKADGAKQPERLNPIMNGMIAAYNDDQMRDIAAYLSEQTFKPEISKNRETIEYGRKLYRAGDQAKGLPACAACHGPTGAGMPAQYPRIAGQFSDYTELQLKGFRAGERTNDANKMMRMVAIKMTDAEIKAVADFIAGLR